MKAAMLLVGLWGAAVGVGLAQDTSKWPTSVSATFDVSGPYTAHPDGGHAVQGTFRLQYLGTFNNLSRYKVLIGSSSTYGGYVMSMPTKPGAVQGQYEGEVIIRGYSQSYVLNGQTVDLQPNQGYRVLVCVDQIGMSDVSGPSGVCPGDSVYVYPTLELRAQPLVKTATQTFKNPTPFVVHFDVYDGTIDGAHKMVGFDLQPGEEVTKNFVSNSGNDLIFAQTYKDAWVDPATGNLVSAPGQDYTMSPWHLSNSNMTISGSTSTDTQPDVDAGGTMGISGATNKTTIIAPTTSTSNPTGGLSEGTFVAGANNIEQAVKAGTGAIVDALKNGIKTTAGTSGGGGTSTVDMTATNSKLDSANTHLTNIEGLLKGGSNYSQVDSLGAAQAAAAGAQKYSDVGGIAPATGAPTVTLPSGAGNSGTFGNVSVGGTTLTFGLSGGVGGTDAMMQAGRAVILVAMIIGFARGCSTHVTTYIAALPQVAAQDTNVGPENLVPGVSQAKTLGTAAAAVTTILTGAAALVAIADTSMRYYGGGIGTVFAAINVPGSGAISAIDQYVPLAAGLGLTLMGAAVPYLLAPTFLGVAAILRFLKT